MPEEYNKLHKAIHTYITFCEDRTIIKGLMRVIKLLNFMAIGVEMKIAYNYEGINGTLNPNITPKMPNDPRDRGIATYNLEEIVSTILKILPKQHPNVSAVQDAVDTIQDTQRKLNDAKALRSHISTKVLEFALEDITIDHSLPIPKLVEFLLARLEPNSLLNIAMSFNPGLGSFDRALYLHLCELYPNKQRN